MVTTGLDGTAKWHGRASPPSGTDEADGDARQYYGCLGSASRSLLDEAIHAVNDALAACFLLRLGFAPYILIAGMGPCYSRCTLGATFGSPPSETDEAASVADG